MIPITQAEALQLQALGTERELADPTRFRMGGMFLVETEQWAVDELAIIRGV